MAIDKLIPQYLNSDTDQKLVKSVEMTDNLNVRVSNDDEGTDGVVKNIKGNTQVTNKTTPDALPSGECRVVGSVANEENKEVLFFVWNENNNHGIYRLDLPSGKYSKLYQDSVLGFRKYQHVESDVIVNGDGETLLYFTDNSNPPMKVNVNRLVAGTYPATLTSGTNEEKLLSLTVAKQPPLNAPTFSLVRNTNIKQNNINDKTFQFAYQYKYTDGEYSALSEYSTLAVAPAQLKQDFVDDGAYDFFNQINVFVNSSKGDVEKIVLYAREGNEGAFFEVKEVGNASSGASKTIAFRNDTLSSFLSTDEVNKSYDNVPQVAKAQAVVGGRLMYGNYKEGYPNKLTNVTSSIALREKPNIYNMTSRIDYSSANAIYRTVSNVPTNSFDFALDFSSLPETVPNGSIIRLNLTLGIQKFTVTPNGGTYGDNVVAFEHPVTRGGEADNIIDTVTLTGATSGKISFPVEGILIKKDVTITGGNGTKTDAITQVADALNYFKCYSVVDADDTDKDQSTEINNKSKVWYAGKANFQTFKSSNWSASISSGLLNVRLKFAGAEIFPKALTTNISSNAITGLAEYEARVNIVKVSKLYIGGQSDTDGNFNNTTYQDASGSTVNATITDVMIYAVAAFSGSSSVFADSIDGFKSFKENASHKFGIVYYDDRGRSSAVNEIDSIEIPSLSERSTTGGYNRRFGSQIDLRIVHSPPSFAKKWQVVYAGSNEYDKFIQYTASLALPSKDSANKNIYVSMSGLEGKSSSYKETKDANLEYKFEKGDKVRVLKYVDSSGNNVYPNDVEFNVLSYDFVSDEKEAPFLVQKGAESSFTGFFLALEDKDETGFSHNDIMSGNDFWNDNTLIEIYTPKKQVEEPVYYGMGKMYDIDSNKHVGDRSVTASITCDINVLNTGVTGFFTSATRLFVDDTIADVNSQTLTITEVIIQTNGEFKYGFSATGSVTKASYTNKAVGNTSLTAITLNQGDVYFRLRQLFKPVDWYRELFLNDIFSASPSFDLDFIEDYSVSDFFSSKAFSKGRPYARQVDAKTVRRKSSITYSDAYTIDSDRLGLSSFNLSLANYTDLDLLYGGITSMVNRGDALTVIQESKASQLPVSRQLLEYSSGQAGVSVSKNVLGLPAYYAGDYGTFNPESVVERFGVVYYVDALAAKVIRLSADGITVISDKGMSSFFEDKFRDLNLITRRAVVLGGFDPDNDEYLISIESVSNADITVGSNTYTLPVDDLGVFSFTEVSYVDDAILWNQWNNSWNEFCLPWEHIGSGIVYLDSVFELNGILIDEAYEYSAATIKILITDRAGTFSAEGTMNLSNGKITFPSTDCTGTSFPSLGSSTSVFTGFTIAYAHKKGYWGSKYSFVPTSYANINNELYSFKYISSGSKIMWRHNVNDTRNNFYGTQYTSIIEAVCNRNPSMIKVFEALGIEGNGTWSGVLTTSDQSTTIGTTDFDEREGHRYSMIFRDTSASTGHKIYLGKVASVSGDKITFTTPINKIPFVSGDELKTASGNTLTGTANIISAVTERKVIQCGGAVSGISAGNDIFVEHTARVDGDPMRDVFLKIKLTSTDTTAFEVHALSVSYDRSRLHNDRVN